MSISTAAAGTVLDGNTRPPEPSPLIQAGETEASRVAVLGCGPAGLLAAHAVALAGHEPMIISEAARKSEIPGAVYLHKPIPEVTTAVPDATVRFVKLGSREGYAKKVYGSRFAPCSWDKFDEGEYPAWSLAKAYNTLWDRYMHLIAEQTVGPADVEVLSEAFPLVVSTIPATALCANPDHEFRSKTVWFQSGARPEVLNYSEEEGARECNVIIYDGRPGRQHYRTSHLFGDGSTEYASLPALPRPNTVKSGFKPLGTDCDCFPEVLRAGRFGTWQAGVLSHHAFERVWHRMFDGLEVEA